MAKLNYSDTRKTMADIAGENGYYDNKTGKGSASELKKALDASLAGIKAERLQNACIRFEYAFLDVLEARNATGEKLSGSNEADQIRLAAQGIKNIFDSSEITAAQVLVQFGIVSLDSLRALVTDKLEYPEIVKRVKLLMKARDVITLARKVGAFGKKNSDNAMDICKQGYEYLTTQIGTVVNLTHGQKLANQWILSTLGYDYKGLQTDERLTQSFAYLERCFSGEQTFDKQVFASVFGFAIVQAVADTASETVSELSLVEQIGALTPEQVEFETELAQIEAEVEKIEVKAKTSRSKKAA